MPSKSKLNGHPIEWSCNKNQWVYSDTKEPTIDHNRPCGRCGKTRVGEHDACIANLPGVMNACCGHGDRQLAYIQFKNGVTISGFEKDK